VTPPEYVIVRNTLPEDFPAIERLCRRVYPESVPWQAPQLRSHGSVFPGGQFVAIAPGTGALVGMAASLIVLWDDYEIDANWRDMTDHGMFTNHDPKGHTLYGAEIMVDPDARRRGVGRAIYAARRELARRMGLLRIRAGARLRGYRRYHDSLTPEAYVRAVVNGSIADPTLTFQLKQRFKVIAVVSGYLQHDPESLGHAAVIEWINHAVAKRRDYAGRGDRFLRSRRSERHDR
jgi:GNAT superfamily N-acetyltransferase